MRATILIVALTVFASSCSREGRVQVAGVTNRNLTATEFRTLMGTLEASWNSNDAKRAAECFAEDALYSAPPSPRIRQGRQALFEFFGGAKGRPRPMTMQWHHVLFDEENQIGAGEYTFTYDIRTHGIVIVRMINGRIANWREYEQESPLDWQAFVGANRF